MLFIALIATLCLSATAKVPAERLAAMTARKMDHRSASGMFPMERLAIVPNEAHLRAEDTTDPGFIVGYAFDDSSSCGGQATYTFGVLTNTCMVSMPSDTATVPVKSYYYTCTEGKQVCACVCSCVRAVAGGLVVGSNGIRGR